MKTFKYYIILFSFLFLSTGCKQKQPQGWLAQSPAGSKYTQIEPAGETIIPSGRIVKPAGRQIRVAPHPFGLVLSPDGNIAVTANSGVRPFSVSIIRNVTGEDPEVQQVPEGYMSDEGILASVYMGLAISPDNDILYVAGGQEGNVFTFNLNTGSRLGEIDCNTEINGTAWEDSYIGDMVLSADGTYLYAVDQLNFRMIVIDTDKKKLIGTADVGRYPFGIALSPDGKSAFVANVGMFEYSKIPGTDIRRAGETGLKFPVYAYQSREMVEGIDTDTLKVPGLGDPNAPESFSVWRVDITDVEKPEVTGKTKTGILVGQEVDGIPAVGGASPNSIAATDEYVFVSNGNNDCISVIDMNNNKVVKDIFLRLDPRLGNLRGAIPFGVALSPDRKRLYVAESGLNAVGVIDVPSLEVVGHIPVGWFPSKLKVSRNGKKLIVANAKGYGSGPNGGHTFTPTPAGSYIGNLMNGIVSVLDIPSDEQLKKETEKVIRFNFDFRDPASSEFDWRRNNPVPLYPGEKESPIKYVVFVPKENRTYDEVFGQVEGGKGDPTLARYGLNQTFDNGSGNPQVDVDVMVNHHKLARQFSMSDNFYCNSDHSADGHRWLAGTYPNEWVEVNVPASYGGGRGMDYGSEAPGMPALVGSNAAVYPEDYNEAGSIWDHMERGGVEFFNFGLGLEMAPGIQDMAFKHTGVRYFINYPVPAPLFHRSSKLFPTYNTSIPDQFRVDMFIEEFNNRWQEDGLPSMLTVYLPNDHGAGFRPDAGYPYTESYMMDNDLALGRLVDFLSHTKYWKNMAIIVTEDDPQGGVDHIDAHRSLLMVISPYAKKNYISHVHYDFGSIMKTFWHILDLPYLNQYDAGATDLADLFTETPDFTPYKVAPVDPAVFNPEEALTPFDADFDWDAFHDTPVLDDPELMQKWSQEDLKERMKLSDPPFAPMISPRGSLFMDRVEVSLKNVYQSAAIYYTLDGTEPTMQSSLYEVPLTISKTTTVKARSFWQTNVGSKITEATFTKANLIPAVEAGDRKPGLTYRYYEGSWQMLPDFNKLTPVKSGIVKYPELAAVKQREDYWGAVFSGFISVPADGIYSFSLKSDDGSKLFIADRLVVNNDGSHSARSISGQIALEKGLHRFRVLYFEDYAGEELALLYKAPGMEMKEIPVNAYSH